MTKEERTEFIEHMQEITGRLGGRRDDIWQDRYVYWMADAIEHILQQMRKEEERKRHA